MKVNLNDTIKNLKGEPIKIRDTEENMTLKFLCMEALIGTYESEKSLSGGKKAERWQFATRLQSTVGNIDLKSEEISLLKELIGMAYTPLAVGQAWQLLDPPASQEESNA